MVIMNILKGLFAFFLINAIYTSLELDTGCALETYHSNDSIASDPIANTILITFFCATIAETLEYCIDKCSATPTNKSSNDRKTWESIDDNLKQVGYILASIKSDMKKLGGPDADKIIASRYGIDDPNLPAVYYD